ncbi:MAG: hypothetical protein R6U98_05055 [Pirellulaceae bacterium]
MRGSDRAAPSSGARRVGEPPLDSILDSILQTLGFVRGESYATQAVLPLVRGLLGCHRYFTAPNKTELSLPKYPLSRQR